MKKEQYMKSRIVLSYFCLFVAYALRAAPITSTQASEKAMAFLYGNSAMKFSAAPITMVPSGEGIQPFYVFNIGTDDGFVIVSGDDAAYPVLGYARSGHFDEDNLPANMKSWLDGYAHELERIQELNLPARRCAGAESKVRENVAPLVTSKWNQNRPYNNHCPLSKNGSSHRPTGCVATAMAQVMYYHKWPVAATAAIPGYSYKDEVAWGGDGSIKTEEALPPTVFDWDSMLDSYDNETMYDEKSAFAVAELMNYVGHGVQMSYGVKASGAFSDDIPVALVRYFGYKNTARLILREDYSSQEAWDEVIYREVSAHRPVVYSGITMFGSGHQFVCDGYENGYFHINWGWAGVSDGFFKLEVLDPQNQGIGGAGSGSSFSEAQTAVIGVQKNYEEDMVHATDIIAESGEQLSADILFHDLTGSYTSLQFDVQLPAGITITGDSEDIPSAVFNQQRSQSANHNVVVNRMNNGLYRFITYSPTNSLFTGSDGALINIGIDVAPSVSIGSYEASISNVVVCDSNMHTKEIRGCKFNIGVVNQKTLIGDADNNGRIDRDDVSSIMQYVMNNAPASFIFQLADVDADGTIDINDAVLTQDIILKASGCDRHLVDTETNESDALSLIHTDKGLSLMLKNAALYKAVQMDVTLSDGLSVTDVIVSSNRLEGFNASYKKIGEDKFRIMLYSTDNRNMLHNEGSIAEFITNVPADEARLSSTVMVTSDLRKKLLPDVFYKVPTGIEEVKVERVERTGIYTLSGIRLDMPVNQLEKGIYIVNGKKVVVR